MEVSGNGGEIVPVGMRVTLDGVERAEAQLLGVADTADAVAARVGNAGAAGATKFSQAFVESSARTQQALGQQSAAVRDAQAAYNRGEASLVDEQLLRREGLLKAQTVDWYTVAAAERVATEADVARLVAAEATTAATVASSKANVTAAVSLQGHGLQLGRLNQELGTFLGRLTGTNTAITRLGAQVGGAFAGYAVTIGVLAAVAAVGFAYEKLTEDTKKAKEEQDKLTESLGKWYDKQRLGATGEFEAQIQAETKALVQMRAALDNTLKGRTFSDIPEFLKDVTKAFVLGSFNPLEATREFEKLWNQYVQGQKAAIAKGGEEIKAAARQAYEDLITASFEAASKKGGNLSSLISGGNALPSQSADATALLQKERAALADLQRAYPGLTDARAKAFNLENQVKAANDIKQIADAERTALLAPLKDYEAAIANTVAAIAAFNAANKSTLDTLDHEADALRKVNDENEKAARASEQAARLAGQEGVARELLTARFKAENEQAEANRMAAGVAYEERTRAIQSEYDRAKALILTTAALRDQAEAQKFLNSLPKEVAAIGTRNAAATQKELTDGLQATVAPLREFQRQFEHDLARSITRGLTEGFASLSGLLDSASRLFDDFAGRAIAGKLSDALFTKYDAAGKVTNTGTFGIEDQKALQQFAIAGVAVIGFANALNNLTGVTNRTAAQLDQQIRTALSLQQDLASYKLSATGSPVAQSLAANTQQAQRLRDETEAAYPGTRLQGERERLLAQIAATEAAGAKRIADDFWASIRAGVNSLLGPAGTLQNQLDALAKTFSENLRAAEALGGPTADITALYLAQAEAAKRAAAELERRQQEDLDVRRIAALGGTDRQISDAQFVYGQRREIADAQAANAPQALIDQILAIQKLEEERRAADFVALQQQAKEDYTVRQLQAEGHIAEAEALRRQLDQQREYQAAVKAGLDEATLAALALAQAAESAAAAAKQAQDAQRALDDLRVRALTAQGNTGGADDLRFQLQQQRELEDAITAGRSQDYIDQLKAVQALEAQKRAADAAAAISGAVNNTARVASASGETTAIANAARVITSSQANRIGDVLTASLVVQREQLNIFKGLAGIPNTQRFAPTNPYAPQTIGTAIFAPPPASFDRIDTGSLDRWAGGGGQQQTTTPAPQPGTGTRGPLTINITINDAKGLGTMSRSEKRALAHDLAKDVSEEIANLEAQQRQLQGNPIVPGA